MGIKCSECAKLARAIDAFIRKAQDDISDDLKDAGYLDTEDSMSAELDLEDNLAECMNGDTEIIADELARADSLEEFVSETWETIKFASALADDVRDVFEHGFKNLIPKLVESYLKDTDMYLISDWISDKTSDWMLNWADTLGQLVKAKSQEKIGGILADALANGTSVWDAAQKLLSDGVYDNFSRARQTALTEMLTAHSVARDEALMQSPSIEDKEWRHSGSRFNKPRKNHVAMDGVVVKKNEPFDLTGKDGSTYHPQYPRDTNLPPGERINCHCLHRGIVSESVLGLPLERRRELQAQARAKINADYHNGVQKGAAGLQPIRKSANDLIPYKPDAPLSATRKGFKDGDRLNQAPNDIIDIRENGGISRYFYDGEGRLALRIDNSDHGFPKLHPHGHGGAHYVEAVYDSNGGFEGWTRNKALTARMIASCKDILTFTTGTIKGGGQAM